MHRPRSSSQEALQHGEPRWKLALLSGFSVEVSMWIKMDDGFATHPKILQAGVIAMAIQVRAICYASQHKTDGHIPLQAIPLLVAGLEFIDLAVLQSEASAVDWPAILVRHRLWDACESGYKIHDFLEWNLSKKAQDMYKKKKSKAGKQGMKSRWNRDSYPITPVITKSYHPTSSYTSTSNIPLSSPNSDSEFEQFWLQFPKKIGKKLARQSWNKANDKPPLHDILQAIDRAKRSEQWLKENGQFIPHPATWLNQGRWSDEAMKLQSNGTRPPPYPPKNDPIGRGLWSRTYGKPEDHGYV